jgi:hypothetical protein
MNKRTEGWCRSQVIQGNQVLAMVITFRQFPLPPSKEKVSTDLCYSEIQGPPSVLGLLME